jgi:hypothetical protein
MVSFAAAMVWLVLKTPMAPRIADSRRGAIGMA